MPKGDVSKLLDQLRKELNAQEFKRAENVAQYAPQGTRYLTKDALAEMARSPARIAMIQPDDMVNMTKPLIEGHTDSIANRFWIDELNRGQGLAQSIDRNGLGEVPAVTIGSMKGGGADAVVAHQGRGRMLAARILGDVDRWPLLMGRHQAGASWPSDFAKRSNASTPVFDWRAGDRSGELSKWDFEDPGDLFDLQQRNAGKLKLLPQGGRQPHDYLPIEFGPYTYPRDLVYYDGPLFAKGGLVDWIREQKPRVKQRAERVLDEEPKLATLMKARGMKDLLSGGEWAAGKNPVPIAMMEPREYLKLTPPLSGHLNPFSMMDTKSHIDKLSKSIQTRGLGESPMLMITPETAPTPFDYGNLINSVLQDEFLNDSVSRLQDLAERVRSGRGFVDEHNGRHRASALGQLDSKVPVKLSLGPVQFHELLQRNPKAAPTLEDQLKLLRSYDSLVPQASHDELPWSGDRAFAKGGPVRPILDWYHDATASLTGEGDIIPGTGAKNWREVSREFGGVPGNTDNNRKYYDLVKDWNPRVNENDFNTHNAWHDQESFEMFEQPDYDRLTQLGKKYGIRVPSGIPLYRGLSIDSLTGLDESIDELLRDSYNNRETRPQAFSINPQRARRFAIDNSNSSYDGFPWTAIMENPSGVPWLPMPPSNEGELILPGRTPLKVTGYGTRGKGVGNWLRVAPQKKAAGGLVDKRPGYFDRAIAAMKAMLDDRSDSSPEYTAHERERVEDANRNDPMGDHMFVPEHIRNNVVNQVLSTPYALNLLAAQVMKGAPAALETDEVWSKAPILSASKKASDAFDWQRERSMLESGMDEPQNFGERLAETAGEIVASLPVPLSAASRSARGLGVLEYLFPTIEPKLLNYGHGVVGGTVLKEAVPAIAETASPSAGRKPVTPQK